MVASLSNAELGKNTQQDKANLPAGFVYVDSIIPSVILDMRYAGSDNFLGRPVAGYNKPVCIFTEKATQVLAGVQAELLENNLCLKIFDCYRPQKAVDDFVFWRSQPASPEMKEKWFPRLTKKEIFEQGYIFEKSAHSRGSTIDLTIVSLSDSYFNSHSGAASLSVLDNGELDMGSPFDLFDSLSHTDSNQINSQQKSNRMMFQALMQKHGFEGIAEEWWHFTLRDEPFKDQYFDFNVD